MSLIRVADVLFFGLLSIGSCMGVRADDDAKNPERGVWIAQSGEREGEAIPADAIKRMRFTFKEDKLLIRGNTADDREIECAYKIDFKQSPMHLDITPPKAVDKNAVLAICEIKGDELKICLRKPKDQAERPKEFSSKAGSELILLAFKREKL